MPEFQALILPAFIAGLVTFLAPCTLPLVPAYLGFISGVASGREQLSSFARRKKILINGVAYIAGFSIIFILFGVLAGFLGSTILGSSRSWLARIGGALIIFFGLLITFSVLSGYFLALNGYNFTREEALSISFLTLGFAQVFHVFNMRLLKSSVLKNDVVNNPYVWGAIGICTGLLGMAILLAPLRNLFHLALPSKEGWAMIAIGSLFPLVVGQIGISILSLRSKKFSTK